MQYRTCRPNVNVEIGKESWIEVVYVGIDGRTGNGERGTRWWFEGTNSIVDEERRSNWRRIEVIVEENLDDLKNLTW
jgi:hypothetical protein